jgi:hypothetical protein
VNREEAKTILLLYRHHAADEQDVEIAEALAVARRDPELARWLEMHCARQFVLREKFRQIPVPEGLREQIISEHAASRRTLPRRQFAAALAVVLLLVGVFWGVTRNPGRDDALDNFRNQMVSFALRGYAMDVLADDVGKIRIYLAEKKSPADFVLPAHLQAAAVEGCAVAGWQDRRVSMLCFRTGRRLAPDTTSDLWLFVADAKSVNNAPTDSALHFAQVNRLTTATWVQDGKIYFLGLEGDEAELKKFL